MAHFMKQNAQPGSQYAAFGNQLAAPKENSELENMFGPHGRNTATANDFDYYFRDHKQSRDFRAQMGAILTEITTGLVMRFPSAPLQLLPIQITDKISIMIHRQEFTGGLFGEVPEEGVTRVLVSTESSEQHALIRRGLAVRVESTSLVLPASQQQFRYAVENLSISAAETMVVVALRRMLEAGNRSRGFVSFFRQNADPLVIARREAELVGSMQSNQQRLVSILKDLHTELKANLNGASPEYADMLVPHNAVKYLQTENRQRSELEGIDLRTEILGTPTTGSVLTPFMVSGGGVRFWDIPAERAARLGRGRVDQVARNILEAQQVFAEWTPVFYEGSGNIYDGVTHHNQKDLYNSDQRNVTVFSCEPRGLVELSFADVLYHGGAGRLPHPSKCGYDVKGDDFTGNNKDGKRRVPWCYYREPAIPQGQDGWCDVASVLGQCDHNVFGFNDFKMVGQSLLAEIVKAVGGADELNRVLAVAQGILYKQANLSITKEAVNDLVRANAAAIASPEINTVVDPVAAGYAGWPQVAQARADSDTGTLKPVSARSFGFSSFYGLRALLKYGVGVNTTDAAAVLNTFQTIERVVKSANSGNVWVDQNARQSWWAHAQQGAMAFSSFTGEAQIPVFVRTDSVNLEESDVVKEDIVPYMRIGVDAMTSESQVDNDAVPAGLRSLVNGVQEYNRSYLRFGPNFDSGFYGANKLVVLQDSMNSGRNAVVVPADFAYCAAYMLGERQVAEKLTRRSLDYFINHVQVLSRKGKVSVAEAYVSALIGANPATARGAVLYAQELVESGKTPADAVQQVINALLDFSASGKKKAKSSNAEALEKINSLGAEDTGVPAGNKASGILFADTDLLNDYTVWKASSAQKAENTESYPFASASSGDKKCAELVLAALKKAGSTEFYWPYSAGFGAIEYSDQDEELELELDNDELAKEFRAEIDSLGADNQRENLSMAAQAADEVRSAAGGQWLRTPLVVSRDQAIQLAQLNSAMKPGNPQTAYTTPYLDSGNNAEAVFHVGMHHISAAKSADSRRSTIHVGLELNRKAASLKVAGAAGGRGAAHIGSHLGRTDLAGVFGTTQKGVGAKQSPLYRIFMSTNFQGNMANLSRVTQPALQMAYLMALGMHCHKPQCFMEMVDANVHVPLAGILFRHKLVLKCASLLLLVGGAETGINYAGDFNSMFGTDTKIKVSELNVTMRHETVINDPHRIMPAFNLLITDCVAGGGVKLCNPWDMHNKVGDLYVALIPVQEQSQVPMELNISGRFTFNSSSTPAANQLHYSSALVMDSRMKLKDKYALHNQGREEEVYLDRRRTRLPEIFLRAPYAVRTNQTQSGWVMREGSSLAARNAAFYEHAYDAFTGNGSVLRDVEETRRDIATIGIHPIKAINSQYRQGAVHSSSHHADGMHAY